MRVGRTTAFYRPGSCRRQPTRNRRAGHTERLPEPTDPKLSTAAKYSNDRIVQHVRVHPNASGPAYTGLQTATARSSGRRGRRFKSCHPDILSGTCRGHNAPKGRTTSSHSIDRLVPETATLSVMPGVHPASVTVRRRGRSPDHHQESTPAGPAGFSGNAGPQRGRRPWRPAPPRTGATTRGCAGSERRRNIALGPLCSPRRG
jgi:hypothetical protein